MNFLRYVIIMFSLRDMQFKNCIEDDLSGHMEMHTGKSAKQCINCKEVDPSGHMGMHTGERAKQCKNCKGMI